MLPDAARNRATHDKIDKLFQLAGLSDDREGGAAGRAEAKNALYRGSADTVDPPGYGDRLLAFDRKTGLVDHLNLGPFPPRAEPVKRVDPLADPAHYRRAMDAYWESEGRTYEYSPDPAGKSSWVTERLRVIPLGPDPPRPGRVLAALVREEEAENPAWGRWAAGRLDLRNLGRADPPAPMPPRYTYRPIGAQVVGMPADDWHGAADRAVRRWRAAREGDELTRENEANEFVAGFVPLVGTAMAVEEMARAGRSVGDWQALKEHGPGVALSFAGNVLTLAGPIAKAADQAGNLATKAGKIWRGGSRVGAGRTAEIDFAPRVLNRGANPVQPRNVPYQHRTPDLPDTISLQELQRTRGIPGAQGVDLAPGSIDLQVYRRMWELSDHHGIEYGLVKVRRADGNEVWRMYSGSSGRITYNTRPGEQIVRYGGHTHPSRSPDPSYFFHEDMGQMVGDVGNLKPTLGADGLPRADASQSGNLRTRSN